ncbi:MAG: hypothetical protein FWC50_05735 [Planctomycetaceae bacterium]|nr:hypothetical protein [Planctomycetaceae bacterium]
MSEALKKTIQVFADAKGPLSTKMLCMALRSSDPEIRQLACYEVIAKKNIAGISELVKNFSQLEPEQHLLLKKNREKLAPAIRAALLNDDPVVQKNGIAATEEFLPFALIPQFLHFMEQGTQMVHLGVIQWTISFLVDNFVKEFNGILPKRPSDGHLLVEISEALQQGLKTWRRHERGIFFDVFFKLSDRLITLGDEFQEMMSNPRHPAHAAMARKLIYSTELHVVRFIMRSFGERLVPPCLLATVAKRTDKIFVRILLESVGYQPSAAFQENLAKIRRFEWISTLRTLLEEIDEGCHRFLVELVRHSGMSEYEKMVVYEQIYRYGKPEGRLLVVQLMRQFTTPDADRLIYAAADDQNENVQAAALSQLRIRKIRNATGKLMQHAHSPSAKVRKIILEELPEFRMRHFLEVMDSLSETQREQMFLIVRQLDPELNDTLARELTNPNQLHKDVLLDCVARLKNVPAFETALMQLIERETDFLIRLKAIKLLALGVQQESRLLLERLAASDANGEIRLLAKRILEIRDNIKK